MSALCTGLVCARLVWLAGLVRGPARVCAFLRPLLRFSRKIGGCFVLC
jgi:hypothetical protein